jgi:hypothetical protein
MIVSLTACAGKTPGVVEVTRVIPQTVEVTRVIPQTVIATRLVQVTAASTPEPLSAAAGTPGPVDIDPAYYDGIIVITQYYTFLGHGLHRDAYQLLSSKAQKPQSIEEYVNNKEKAFKTVNIITIQPYYLWANGRGKQEPPETGDERRFYVQIKAWGEGNMSGSVVNGRLQTLFLTLIKEDGEWKIDTFATAPWKP